MTKENIPNDLLFYYIKLIFWISLNLMTLDVFRPQFLYQNSAL